MRISFVDMTCWYVAPLLSLFGVLIASTAAYAGPMDSAGTASLTFDLAQTRQFFGMCDSSAAVRLPDGNLLIANDEENAFYVYAADGNEPLNSIAVNNLIDLPDRKQGKKSKVIETAEIDLEAAVMIGDRIWWTGSHGHDKKSKVVQNRRTLFASNVPSSDLSDFRIVRDRINLIDIFLANPQLLQLLNAEVRDLPPHEGGLNIEGLSEGVDQKGVPDGSLLFGFRSPLTGDQPSRGPALVVKLAPQGDSFVFQRMWRLDLGDRGVRAMSYADGYYLLVAGAKSAAEKFAIYRWDGNSDEIIQVAEVGDFKAEAIVDMGDYWLLLSDDDDQVRVTKENGGGASKPKDCKKQFKQKSPQDRSSTDVYFRGAIAFK